MNAAPDCARTHGRIKQIKLQIEKTTSGCDCGKRHNRVTKAI